MPKVTLKHAIQINGEMVKELDLAEPTLAILEDVNLTVNTNGEVKFNLGDIRKVLAGLANIPPSSAKKIHIMDLISVAGACKDFLGEFLPTGGTSEQK